MQKRAENEVLGHFLEFGTSDGLDIAYHDSLIKGFLMLGHGKRSCIII